MDLHSLQLFTSSQLDAVPFRSFLYLSSSYSSHFQRRFSHYHLHTISMLSLLSSRAVVMITLASFAIRGSFAAVAAIPGTKCDVSSAVLSLPATAAAGNVTVPTDSKPKYIAIGLGTQLYNCTGGAWVTNGAKANLYDVSCLYAKNPKAFATLQKAAASLATSSATVQKAALKGLLGASQSVEQLGSHYFVTTASLSNTTSTIAPQFDFRRAAGGCLADGSQSGFVELSKAGSVASPDGSQNVAWLDLKAISGTLAKQVFRVETVNGVATGSCSAGQQTSIPYAAEYWFFA